MAQAHEASLAPLALIAMAAVAGLEAPSWRAEAGALGLGQRPAAPAVGGPRRPGTAALPGAGDPSQAEGRRGPQSLPGRAAVAASAPASDLQQAEFMSMSGTDQSDNRASFKAAPPTAILKGTTATP